MRAELNTPTALQPDRFARPLRVARIESSLPKNECPHRRSDQLPDRCVMVPVQSGDPDSLQTNESCCNAYRQDPNRHHPVGSLPGPRFENRSVRRLCSTSVCRRELRRDTSRGSYFPTRKRSVVLEATTLPKDPVSQGAND